MTRVLRHQLSVGDSVARLPPAAPVLHVDIKAGESTVSIWVAHEDGCATRERVFKVVGTGHEFGGRLVYVGSCLDETRQYVWHVFEDVDALIRAQNVGAAR